MIFHALRSIKERGVRSMLLILGVLIVSAAFALLLATVQTTKVTVEENIAQYWRTTYDILVRPTGSRSSTEEEYGLVQANHLSNLEGGITFEEWNIIKAIPGVEIAAPIAFLGYFNLVFHTPIDVFCPEPGFFRLENKLMTSDGLHNYETLGEEFFYCSEPGGSFYHLFNNPFYNWNALAVTGKRSEPDTPWFEEMVYRIPVLLAAIDPREESSLVDLDQAMVSGNFLSSLDNSSANAPNISGEAAAVPIIMNTQTFVDFSLETSWYRIKIPFSQEKLDHYRDHSGKEYLAQHSAELIIKRQYEGQNAYEIALTSLSERGSEITINSLDRKPPGVSYQDANSSPGEEEITLKAAPHGSSTTEHGVIGMPLASFDYQTLFREIGEGGGFGGSMRFLMQGIYDIEYIPAPEDLSRVPLETYYPPRVLLQYDESGEPISPITLGPTFNTNGYITSPPLALTTIQTSRWMSFNSEAPISAIRVRLSGIDVFTPETQSKIEVVAAEIIERTGLNVDITAGSSPKSILVHLPAAEPAPLLGYVEEGWLQMGVSYYLAQEIKQVNALLFLVLFTVSGLYILNTSLVSALGRQREFALQKALGWRDGTIFSQVITEGVLTGLSAGALGLLVAVGLASFLNLEMPARRAALILPISVALCFLGSIIPAYIASRTSPRKMLAKGEVSAGHSITTRLSTLISVSLHHSLRRKTRTFLSMLTACVSTLLVSIYIGGIMHSRSYLAGTLLGEHILLHIGSFQLAIAGISFLVAGIAITDILFISVAERRREIGMLKAVGWRSTDVALLFLGEGLILGSVGGFTGILLGGAIMAAFLNLSWAQIIVPSFIALLIPSIVGFISAIVPAWFASRTLPAEAIKYE